MLCTFLVYEKDGDPGNDIINTDPYDWLSKVRAEYPDSSIIITRWQKVEVRESDFKRLHETISIEYDEKKRVEMQAKFDALYGSQEDVINDVLGNEPEEPDETEKPDPIAKPKGWALRKVFVDAEGNVYHKGVEQPELKGTISPEE